MEEQKARCAISFDNPPNGPKDPNFGGGNGPSGNGPSGNGPSGGGFGGYPLTPYLNASSATSSNITYNVFAPNIQITVKQNGQTNQNAHMNQNGQIIACPFRNCQQQIYKPNGGNERIHVHCGICGENNVNHCQNVFDCQRAHQAY